MEFSSRTILNAYKVLDGEKLEEKEALALIETGAPYLMDLYSLADKVRRKYCKESFMTCGITNAKSGACSENCSFCAQSAHNPTGIKTYPLKSADDILNDARKAKSDGAESFCLVLSGRGYEKPDEEFLRILDTVTKVIQETGLELHVSPGILSDETAKMLKNAGVSAVNHNIETAPSYFHKVCTTHSAARRILTVRAVKKAGMKACCGGIIGLGEGPRERVEMALALNDINVDIIPLNILRKIEGTAAKSDTLSIREILNTIAVFRLVNPGRIIKIAAGRESALEDYQGLAFHAGANGMLIGGYLTLGGRSPEKDKRLIESLD
ncbi:MAG: biotin synthase BioB [Lentisphaerae bacterium GWF2_45_14]|nr:MAG: biotin synthase BioB [Lentisphaerae bacterium GWF2_45_14]